MKFIGKIILFLAMFALGACNAAGDTLAGTQWKLIQINGQAALANARVRLNFDEKDKLSGIASCNHFTGQYTQSGSKLELQPGASTLMACEEQVMAQEQAFLAALGSVQSYTLQDQQLALKDASGTVILLFEAVQRATLQDTEWRVSFYNEGQSVVSSDAPASQMSARFGADGNLVGNAGCNQFNATYKIDGEKITIGAIAATRMACAEDIMRAEAAFLQALQKVERFKLGEDSLELLDAGGTLWVSLRVAP